MATRAQQQKEERGMEVPSDFRRFLVGVYRQIEAGDPATTCESGDFLQARCAFGGLCREGSDLFGFTYFNRIDDGTWEIVLTKDQIRRIASGETKDLPLWLCRSPGCANAFSDPDDLCDECDWEREPEDEDQQASAPSMADFVATLVDEDPDFGKVRNDPGEEFAFEVIRPFTVAEVAALAEHEAGAQIGARDDFGNAVTSVPLAESTRSVSTGVTRYLTPLGEEESLSPGVLVHRVATHVMAMTANPEEFELYDDELEGIRQLRFCRFFHAKPESWWTCTFDSDES